MNSAPKHRRPTKVRRTGRHAAPSQLEKAAEKAGKAAPAAAIAGILVAGPAHAAVAAPVTTVAVAGPIHTDAMVSHLQQVSGSYVVQPGDSLSKIAKNKLGDGNAWKQIFDANTDILKDPNKIFPGQKLKIPKKG